MMELSQEFWKNTAYEMSLAKGQISEIVRDISFKMGIAKTTIYRNVKKFGFSSGRKRRNDAGQISDVKNAEILEIASLYHKKTRFNAKESRMPLEKAIEMWEEAKGKQLGISASRLAQILRQRELARNDAIKATPKLELRSLYSNHVHQYDMSVCRYYLNPDNKIVYIKNVEDYKNKAGRFNKKQRLVRHVLIDHTSGAFYVEYSTTLTILDDAEFLYNGWKKKEDDYIFHGVPTMLITDNDKALKSRMMKRLFSSLDISYPDSLPYTPWTKGVVEQFNLTWERWFEMGFIHQKSGDIDEINRWAFEYAVRFQKTRQHTRHKQTRFVNWDSGIEGHLREIVDYQTYQRMLHSDPVSRKVNSQGKFSFQGRDYKLKDLHSTKIDVVIHPYLFEKNGGVTIQWPSVDLNFDNFPENEVKTITVLPTEKDANGFSINAPNVVDFGHYKAIAKTESEKNFELLTDFALDDGVVKPFSNNLKVVEDIQFKERTGVSIMAKPDLNFDEEFSFIQAKGKISSELKRAISPEENIYIGEQLRSLNTIKEEHVNAVIDGIKMGKHIIEALCESKEA